MQRRRATKVFGGTLYHWQERSRVKESVFDSPSYPELVFSACTSFAIVHAICIAIISSSIIALSGVRHTLETTLEGDRRSLANCSRWRSLLGRNFSAGIDPSVKRR